MRGCPQVTGAAISSLFARYRLLSNVEVSGLRTISSGMFGGGLLNLQGFLSLDVGNCNGFDDLALQHIAGLKTLETLILCANPAIFDIGLEDCFVHKSEDTFADALCEGEKCWVDQDLSRLSSAGAAAARFLHAHLGHRRLVCCGFQWRVGASFCAGLSSCYELGCARCTQALHLYYCAGCGAQWC
mmetsp:Transcript_59494/g.96255  ORF Transcript_59494/g.96255 Transcript_59494/m.96255 type:complete len:186 (-) Transcript_59494:23-580(-)